MKKRILTIAVMAMLVLALTGCWAGEIGVTTVFNSDGSGTRTIVLDVMDDTLSTDPIINLDDPDQEEGKGAIVNDYHITGGLIAIQTWLEDNAPEFITVEDATVDGYHRYFTMTYSWDDFDDFLAKYEMLVDLSPSMDWDDFTAEERPTLTIEGLYKKTLTFTETKIIVEASLDWAIDGIWNSIYDAADLAGFVTKADISVLSGYTVEIGDDKIEELAYYDADALEGDGVTTGVRIQVESDSFTLSSNFTNTGMIVGTIVVVVAILGAAVFFVLKAKK
ncbi:MAG: hypothetical protein JEZ05_07815 [Tenericutes bacterium]|nr:hypothetical protein [Mycoplasmatota bacterium]